MSMTERFYTAAVCFVLAWNMTGVSRTADAADDWTLVGWNDLGMHCMDADYSVMSILPPYNTVHAQLIDSSGNLVTDPQGITVTYEAVADPSGSINTTSAGKTGFWDHVLDLFGVALAPDQGLAGFGMPGAGNAPQDMVWDGPHNWFTGEGIPLTPTDDSLATNPYPLMRLVARDGAGTIVAMTDVVLPVSDEMDCRSCHASGTSGNAQPGAGWVWDPNPERDYRRNILLLHDDVHLGDPDYQSALAAVGYSSSGLHVTAIDDGTSILCASCHPSNALPGTGVGDVPPLTQAVHSLHADVEDPVTGLTLDDSDNRSACYRCHPGSETRCLRGAMGAAVADDGSLAMQCQSCHGGMSLVGDSDREGWLEQPTCQNCHTGTAVHNNGEIRYTTAFDGPGVLRTAVDATFATQTDVPMPGFSLYRFSEGHGGLQCSACHGSPHAIFPASHGNDNLQSIAVQGHEGTLVECASCHGLQPDTFDGGPHGMHPVGESWVDDHEHIPNTTPCRDCHGSDSRGTVLSRSHADRTIDAEDYGVKHFWRGYQIGCYACHNGPNSEDPSPNTPAEVENAAMEVAGGATGSVGLTVFDIDGNPLELRVVSQPDHGVAWIDGTTAHYRSDPGYAGPDVATYAAWDGWADSNLGTITVDVTAGPIFVDGFESGDTTIWSLTMP